MSTRTLLADTDITQPFRFKAGLCYFTPGRFVSGTISNNELNLSPFFVGTTASFDRIGLNVTGPGTGGSVLRLGVYADDGHGYPGALVLDAGTIVADSIHNTPLTISLTLNAGMYWIGAAAQNAAVAQPTTEVLSNDQGILGVGSLFVGGAIAGYHQGSISGALPSNFTTSIASSTLVQRVALRAA